MPHKIKRFRKRWLFAGAAAVMLILAFLIWFGGLPLWRSKAFLAQLEPVAHRSFEITRDMSGDYVFHQNDDTDFRILQLTDIHLGGSFVTQRKDRKAMQAVYSLAAAVQPDLIVITGDLAYPIPIQTLSRNNLNPMLMLCDLMNAIDIPWCFVYGNHDTEWIATHPGKEINYLFANSQTCLFAPDYSVESGRSNQLIQLRNADGSLNQVLVLLDSNSYASLLLNDYDAIHEDQVAWYEKRITELSALEGHTVRSLLFFHIPLQEFQTAYDLYRAGSPDVTYLYGSIGEANEKIACSDHPSTLFDTAVRLGSTQAMFVGHDHLNTLSVAYKGIRLTYGLSIDYLAYPGIGRQTAQRGGTCITVHPDGSIEIDPILLRDITQK